MQTANNAIDLQLIRGGLGQFSMPITALGGSLFHTDSQL